MSIPQSGPLSMSMFNNVVNRTIDTSNSILAGAAVPTEGSLVYIAGQLGPLDQNAPHLFSEWYGYAPTTTTTTSTTTTTTTPPITTSTTTTTTSEGQTSTTTTSTTTTTTTIPPTTTTTTTTTTSTTTSTTTIPPDCTFTGGTSTRLCNILLSQVQTTNPTNQAGNNGTATLTFSNAVAPVTYTLNGVSQGTATSPLTLTGLSANTTYTVALTDSVGCFAQTTFQLGDTQFVFDADYIMVTYEFTDGDDLDTRTRIVTPNVGQVTSNDYVGYDKPNPGYNNITQISNWPRNVADPYEVWGGDNQGIGFESVLIYLNRFKTAYPSAAQIVIDLRAFWFYPEEKGVNPVVAATTLWKGGTPVKSEFIWTNPTATATSNVDSVGKVITADRDNGGRESGQRVATLTYTLTTGKGVLNNNDTTTPSV